MFAIADTFVTSHAGSTCSTPSVRKEWRTLSATEQQSYIDAIKCISEQPSRFQDGTSRHDDFALAHIAEGLHIHYAAAFLPWHRHFIHTFEQTLRKECNYTRSLVYWDWSLDAEDLAQSPIWSPSAFGPSGNSSGKTSVGNGYCVVDGPFANVTRHWQAKVQGGESEILSNPHCLSRGFQTGTKKEELQSRVSQQAVENILVQDSYASFFTSLEDHVHNAIPQFVRGDFLLQTAPNDPVFYLHHTQIDRLWWIWQQKNNASHLWQYEGPLSNSRFTTEGQQGSANLSDLLTLGEYGKTVKVQDVISTRHGELCYIY
ncbi:hypothetical protein NLG97_g6771 [Lecanicillium saksenae]|uniref:Uncharacterized protein n=1 Tax=Lecanicillium saksenae TaxID=468837 RepID=A0ACC1QNQ0_9HYPO|nr:hypothetical protein NLG97_g6771 [Lecanicillium saksenae]